VIGKLIYSRKFYGEYDLVGTGYFDPQEEGSITVAHIGTTGVKQGRR
jgi:hypothetical protein